MNSAPTPTAAAAQLHRRGILFVVSAPSGGGKSTLLNALRPTADFLYSVSCTTRAPRPGEIDGEDYHFISREEFERRIAAREFIEYAQVHGNFYGTPRDRLLRHLEAGTDILIDIDIQGAAAIRAQGGPEILSSLADVFIMPPSMDELRRRLLKRGTETEEQMNIRLERAAIEMQSWRDYRYTIITGSVEDDVRNFTAIMRAERAQRSNELCAMSAPVVVVGVTGSIAAYKAADLVSKLGKRGYEIHVVMTHGAQEFITPLTFQTLTRNQVVTSVFDGTHGWKPGHIDLADRANLLLIAPATANVIAELACGLAGNPIGEIALATLAPVLIAPAMNGKMWLHAATQQNVATLKARGAVFIGPEEGMLACGYEGLGRLWNVDDIVERAATMLAAQS